MLRAGLVPATVVVTVCCAVAGLRAGVAGLGAAALGGLIVLVALVLGPAVFAVTRGSSPHVTFVVGVLTFFGLTGALALVLAVLVDAEWLAAEYLALSLAAGIVAGTAGMLRWTVRARMPVYESEPPGAEPPA